jgi:hypothetical protein
MESQHNNLIQTFNGTTNELLQLLSSLTEEQLNGVLIPGKWTPGQLGLHLYKAYAAIYILKGNTKPTDRPIDQKVPTIKNILLNFDKSYDAPSDIMPTNELIQKERLLKGLRERIAQYTEVLHNEDLSLICTDFAIPQYGQFTRLEWLWNDTYHTVRHVDQLKKMLLLFTKTA